MGTTGTSAAVWAMLAERWRKTIRATALSDKTEQRYLSTAHRWAKWLDQEGHDIEPDDVEAHHVDDFIVDIIDSSSAANAAHHYRNLRVFFAWLVKRKEIKTGNPFDETEPPKVPEKITDLLDDEHHAALLLTCSGKDFLSLRDRAIILLFVDTGMRVSELHSIQVKAIDLKTKQLMIVGKGKKIRVVRFGNSTGLALARYLKVREKHPLADSPALWLSSRKTKPLTIHGIQSMLHHRGKRAKVPGSVYPHRFRHDFSDRWQANGGSEAGLMEIAGWASTKMPRHYGKAAKTRRALAEHERISPADSLVA
ncbi:tyrosine-type recombinase/integrase [Actinokineospora iranica]|uniref:Site-specific recombinase XerD n=1 Tax=Actinokineospora iranica TaxID=1271860 RepID=A0A1G6NYI5_9PSEU|nr:tyrosine-type recombinase/integrase [Actinokineospora iranica]SDC72778.1 Site-specific recombinase XerD [Actinokineospora iranica]